MASMDGLKTRYQIEAKNFDSVFWKSIAEVWDHKMNGQSQKIGDGKIARFWINCWIGQKDLINQTISAIPKDWLDHTVADYVDQDNEWNIPLIQQYLRPKALNLLTAHYGPVNELGPNTFAQKFNSNGEFSIQSMYKLTHIASLDSHIKHWKDIWKWRGPGRIHLFIWQCQANGLLTNCKRNRRGLGSPYCSRCPSHIEDTIHVLRDCQQAKLIWDCLLNHRVKSNFFTWDLNDWIYQNLMDNLGMCSDFPWSLLWGTTVWKRQK